MAAGWIIYFQEIMSAEEIANTSNTDTPQGSYKHVNMTHLPVCSSLDSPAAAAAGRIH